MGLRINNNISAFRALRNLRINDRNQASSLERLSTGLSINRASDNPSGLVISEQLRAQISSLKQAVDNTQTASGLISTAEAALQEVSDLLVGIQDSVVFALNEGGASPEQVAAEQASVDSAIAAITRIANTTRYANRSLLNGASDFQTSAVHSLVDDLHVRRFEFSPSVSTATPTYSVTVAPERRAITIFATASGTTTLRITGSRGTADITVASGTEDMALADAVNSVRGVTGVFVDTSFSIWTALAEEFGTQELADIKVISGTLIDKGAAPPTTAGMSRAVFNAGVDGVVSINGNAFTGNGRHFNVQTATLEASFSISPTGGPSPMIGPGPFGPTPLFTVEKSGLQFQLGTKAAATDSLRLGIQSVSASTLGADLIPDPIADPAASLGTMQFGFLESLKTGGANDLDSNPGNARKIIDKAINQVASLRGYLGAVQSQTLEPNIDSLGIAIENLVAAESSIRDLDFAEETANFTRTQILFQAGTSVLASANLIPQSVLTLLR